MPRFDKEKITSEVKEEITDRFYEEDIEIRNKKYQMVIDVITEFLNEMGWQENAKIEGPVIEDSAERAWKNSSNIKISDNRTAKWILKFTHNGQKTIILFHKEKIYCDKQFQKDKKFFILDDTDSYALADDSEDYLINLLTNKAKEILMEDEKIKIAEEEINHPNFKKILELSKSVEIMEGIKSYYDEMRTTHGKSNAYSFNEEPKLSIKEYPNHTVEYPFGKILIKADLGSREVQEEHGSSTVAVQLEISIFYDKGGILNFKFDDNGGWSSIEKQHTSLQDFLRCLTVRGITR